MRHSIQINELASPTESLFEESFALTTLNSAAVGAISAPPVKQQLVDLIKQHQHQDGWILLIAPTQLPDKEWASHYQLSLQNVLVVHQKQIRDLPETLRQAITSPSCKVVINFANQLEQSDLEKFRKLAVTNNIWFYQYEQLTQNGFTH